MSLVGIRLFSSAVPRTPADPRDRFRFGVGVDVLLGIGLGVRLEPDTEPDTHGADRVGSRWGLQLSGWPW